MMIRVSFLLFAVWFSCSFAVPASDVDGLADARVDAGSGEAVVAAVERKKDALVSGLVAATFTPFRENGAIDVDAVQKQAEYLNATGVHWIFLSGTTGESVKLTFAERKAQTETWMKLAPSFGIRVIVHVGDESIETAKSLAAHAETMGADAIGAMPTVFFKPSNVDALALSMQAIAAAAPSLPFFYYHIPSMTGVSYAAGLLSLVEAIQKIKIPTFAGIKYTGLYTFPGFMDAERILRYNGGKYAVLSGRDEMMLQALAAGITGFVGSQYNFAGDMYNQLIATFRAGNLTKARAMQLVLIDLIGAWNDVSEGVDGCKNVLNVAPGGFRVGDARLPSIPISHDDLVALSSKVHAWCGEAKASGLFQSSKMCDF